MWPRVVETMLGVWLLVSPFIFRHPDTQTSWWINDLLCGILIPVFALASFYRPLRRAHLVLLGLGLWLIGFGYFAAGDPNPPALQNNIIVGLLLLLFAIIPSEADLPPESWRPYFDRARMDHNP